MHSLKASQTFTTGIALAPAFILRPQELSAVHAPALHPEEELLRFRNAVESVREELSALTMRDGIFAAHLEILQDPSMVRDISSAITSDGKNAEWAVEDVIASCASSFLQMEDEYMRLRSADIRDVGKRLMLSLKGLKDQRLSGIDRHVIVIAKSLAPSDTASMDLRFVDGFITEEGGITSHVAIMAKSLGIPALVGAEGILDAAKDGMTIAMDAGTGDIFCNPDHSCLLHFDSLLSRQNTHKEKMAAAAGLPAMTKDGKAVTLYANVGNLSDIEHALSMGAAGVGLFRTEFLYMENTRFPTEEEQYLVYMQAAKRLGERELIVRTLDTGGDKTLPYFQFEPEANPFLGYRAIRFCLDRPEIFKTQLRALLRAAIYGNLKIMYPMIADEEELIGANALLKECKQELSREGKEYNPATPVGMMIETPASVLLAERFAGQVDFFSIGTNDLTQYILAADRGNHRLSHLYDPFRPAVLKAVSAVISAGHAAGIPVGMCGEFAGNPRALPLLLGMGLDELSVSATTIPELKLQLQTLDSAAAAERAKKILSCHTLEEIRKELRSTTG